MHFYLPPTDNRVILMYWKSYVYNTLLAYLIRETVIFWSFKMLARIWLLLALRNQASAYVAPVQWYLHFLPSRTQSRYYEYLKKNCSPEGLHFDYVYLYKIWCTFNLMIVIPVFSSIWKQTRIAIMKKKNVSIAFSYQIAVQRTCILVCFS